MKNKPITYFKIVSYIIAAALVCLSAARPAQAGPILLQEVPATAAWVVHCDFEAMRATQLYSLILQEFKQKPEFIPKLQQAQAFWGFDPLNDLTSMTLYGEQYGQGHEILIVKGNYNRQRLMELLLANPDYEESNYGSYSIYRWTDEHGRKYGTFFQDKTVVIASSPENVQLALETLVGKRESMKTSGNLSGLVGKQEGLCLLGGARSYQPLLEGKPHARVLKNSEEVYLSLGESQQQVYVDLRVKAPSDATADQIYQVAEGIIAFGMLMQQERPVLSELAQAAQLSLWDQVVNVRLTYPAEKTFEALKNLKELRHHRRPLQKP
ncbi:MAG: hypothetical protein JW709_08530 [Sedimentisphaerales bacterium]|nr:hypothetical protein [Sedimentisphaerales bacterium]